VRLPLKGGQQRRGQFKHADNIGLNNRSRHGEVGGIGSVIFGSGNARIVYETVEPGKLFTKIGRKSADGVRVFHVNPHTAHAGIGAGDLVKQGLPSTGNDDLIAASMKILSKRASDSAGAAGPPASSGSGARP
jgi:hypothetical protein